MFDDTVPRATRTIYIGFRGTQEEQAEARRLAANHDLSVSDLLRKLLRDERARQPSRKRRMRVVSSD